jgi:polyhydroxyalkanoate synthesis regulator phasin
MRDLRDRGDGLARQGRLRMDMVQAQRRLRRAHEALGKAIHLCLQSEPTVDATDPKMVELRERVDYYQDEVQRLQNDLKQDPVNPE